MNWTKISREARQEPPLKKRLAYYEINKPNPDAMLKKVGWQICPRCGGGRHPYFTLCKKCRTKG